MSEVTYPVTVHRVEIGPEGNYTALFTDEFIGEQLNDRFLFPPKWHGIKEWGALKQKRFQQLMKMGSIINITFNEETMRLSEITDTEPGTFTEFMINEERVDDYFAPKVDESKKEVKTTSTTSTSTMWTIDEVGNLVLPMTSTPTEWTTNEVGERITPVYRLPITQQPPRITTPSSIELTLKHGASQYRTLVSLKGASIFLTREYLSRLSETHPEELMFQAMLKELK